MSMLWMFLLGLAVPVFAKVFWPRGAPEDLFVGLLLGLVGSMAGGLIVEGVGGGSVGSALGSVVGAVLLVYGYGVARARFGRRGAGA